MTTLAHILASAGIALAPQLDCMTEAIYHEARGEPWGGMVAVGLVLKNRVLAEEFPDTPCGVVEQPRQFSYIYQKSDRGMYEEDARERAHKAAYAVLNSPPWPSMDNVLFFHTTAVKPSWDYTRIKHEVTIGNHKFYSLVN